MLKRIARVFCCLMLQFLPGRIRRRLFATLLGWDVDESARIGLSLIEAEFVKLGRKSRLGHFNVVRNLLHFEIGENGAVGQWNWITANRIFFDVGDPGQRGRFVLGNESAIASRAYIDCAGGLEIGCFTTLAGVRETILTHQINVEYSAQTVRPVRIGSYCLICSNVGITPGSIIPDRSVVAMGAVVTGRLNPPGMVWAGVPAKAIKSAGDAAYFTRSTGFVYPRDIVQLSAHGDREGPESLSVELSYHANPSSHK